MGVILRTAGAARTKTEIKRDFEYLLRAWETVRDLTLRSTAPTLVYEEGSLVKRSIRDLYNKDIDEVIVAGDDAYRDARDFMRMLMPSHAKNVRLYKESQPILTRYGIESQLDAMFSPIVQLRSGGYIVLNQAEALVAIDVNSGRATREHHIEDTALKTNLEAAEEIARQLRLRDLAGLIVIDFIDMDEHRNNRSVERRLKDCLKNDRARIQVGRISHFGLLEMSRQRIRTSVLESSTDKCPHCGGTGHVRSVSSVALQCLRMIEESLQRGPTHNIILRTRSEIALYVLNQKRAHLYDLEHRFQVSVSVNVDPMIGGQLPFVIEKGEQVHSLEQARVLAAQATSIPIADHDAEEAAEAIDSAAEEEELDIFDAEGGEPAETGEADDSSERGETGDAANRRRRRRRRRGRRGDAREAILPHEAASGREFERGDEREQDDQPERAGYEVKAGDEGAAFSQEQEIEAAPTEDAAVAMTRDFQNGQGEGRRRRRGRRGSQRGRRDEAGVEATPPEGDVPPIEEEVAEAVADFAAPEVPNQSAEQSRHVPWVEGLAEDRGGTNMRAAQPSDTAMNGLEQAGHHDTVAAAKRRARGEPASDDQPVREATPPANAGTVEHGSAAPTSGAAQTEETAPRPEASRRRSTIREPAYLSGYGVSPAPAAPAGPATEGPEEGQATPPSPAPGSAHSDAPADVPAEPRAPRRAGWWAKRIFSDKA